MRGGAQYTPVRGAGSFRCYQPPDCSPGGLWLGMLCSPGTLSPPLPVARAASSWERIQPRLWGGVGGWWGAQRTVDAFSKTAGCPLPAHHRGRVALDIGLQLPAAGASPCALARAAGGCRPQAHGRGVGGDGARWPSAPAALPPAVLSRFSCRRRCMHPRVCPPWTPLPPQGPLRGAERLVGQHWQAAGAGGEDVPAGGGASAEQRQRDGMRPCRPWLRHGSPLPPARAPPGCPATLTLYASPPALCTPLQIQKESMVHRVPIGAS